MVDAVVRQLTRGSEPVEDEQSTRTPDVVTLRLTAAGFRVR
jgi:hypothetical protein